MGILDGWAIRIGGAAVFAAPFDGNQLLTTGATVQYLVTAGTTLSFRLGSHARVGASIDPRLDQLIAEHEVTVGRAPDCGLELKRAGLRYHHAVIREDGQYLSVEALAEANQMTTQILHQ